MCRPRPYITGALHFRWLSFLLKIITFCLYVCNSSTKVVLFRIFFDFIEKKQFMFMITLSIDKKKKCFKGKTIFLHIKRLNCYCMNQHANATIDIYMLNTIVFNILGDY